MKNAFSLIELLVGLVVSMILVGIMAIFMGDVSYVFQDQKMVVRDRGQLQRNMLLMSRELMETGYKTEERSDRPAQIERVDEAGNTVYDWFIDVGRDDSGFPILSFWASPDSMDLLSSQDDSLGVIWNQIVYQIGEVNHPVTNETMKALFKNGIPFIFGTTDFVLELGLDPDGDGIVEDGDWSQDYPSSEDEKELIYSALKKIRISITTQTIQASKKNNDQPVESSMTQEIYLRNRRQT